jgi:hypothetical protein
MRISKKLAEQIAKMAEQENRSFNNMVEVLLQKAVGK